MFVGGESLYPIKLDQFQPSRRKELPCLAFDRAHHCESKLREPVVTEQTVFTSKRVKGETVGDISLLYMIVVPKSPGDSAF